MRLTAIILRIGVAVSSGLSAVSHSYLYAHGYQHIPTIGTAFLVQASVGFALALLIVVGGPEWLSWGAAMVAAGALVAFVLSRTVGLVGFSEHGWQPSPHAATSVAAELFTVGLWAAVVLVRRQSGTRFMAGKLNGVIPATRPSGRRIE